MSDLHPPTSDPDSAALVRAACAQAGIAADAVELIRDGENAIYRLAGRTVVRISRPGQEQAAAKEVAVARWLEANAVPAVRTAPDVTRQPLTIAGRPITFWQELPAHRHGTPREIAHALRRLHALPPPSDFTLDPLAPMTRLRERIDAATTLNASDRNWLRNRVETLTDQYMNLPPGLPLSVLHGDAWAGNVVVTAEGETALLDLERFSTGPPEWDLVSTAIKHSSFGWITAGQYAEFVDVYGQDVTTWPGFQTLRDIRELRMTCYLAQQAPKDKAIAREAQNRVDSIRGRRGTRPWHWEPAL